MNLEEWSEGQWTQDEEIYEYFSYIMLGDSVNVLTTDDYWFVQDP